MFPRELVYDVFDLELVKPLSSVTVSDVGVDRKGGSYETSRAFSESAPARYSFATRMRHVHLAVMHAELDIKVVKMP